VAHFVPQAHVRQASFDDLIQVVVAAEPQHAWPKGHIVIDRLWEGVRALKDHAHPLPQAHHIVPGLIDLLVVQQYVALQVKRANRIVHAVQAAHKGRLAAARGTDERRDLPLFDLEGDIREHLFAAVKGIEVLGSHLAHGGLASPSAQPNRPVT